MSTVKLTRRDERMVSKRARSEPLSEPSYDLELVPTAQDATLLERSCLTCVTERDTWRAQLTELLLLCNEAAWRSARRHDAALLGLPPPAAPAEAKPLVLEYILDRIVTDEPLTGYQLRTRAEGWLQGFVTFTTFTTWQTYFRWDSLDLRAGITLDDLDAHVVDEDGELSRALDECGRFGDPDGCGVIWPRVAEITLLGGLGCGAHLLQLALDHLASLETYDFVVLQARQSPAGREGVWYIREGVWDMAAFLRGRAQRCGQLALHCPRDPTTARSLHRVARAIRPTQSGRRSPADARPRGRMRVVPPRAAPRAAPHSSLHARCAAFEPSRALRRIQAFTRGARARARPTQPPRL